MKKSVQSAIAIVAVLWGASLQAQTASTENSVLWEVSGNGLSQPSYLFGTMHMMCEKDFILKDKTNRAFANTQKLAMELDLDDPKERVEMQKMVQSEIPLSKALTAAEYQTLDDFLKKQIGAGAASFENFNLVGIVSLAIIKALNCPPKMFEMELSQMAEKRGIEILGLETIQQQLTAFDQSYTTAELIQQLPLYNADYLQQMVKAYNSEDLNALYALVIDPRFMDANAKTVMVDSRNANWITQMPKLMQKHPTFFAVGAAHLPGDKGLIRLLKQAGYTLKPVTD